MCTPSHAFAPLALWRAGGPAAWLGRTAIAVAVLLGLVAAGNAAIRPGCSLLPVALPSDPDRPATGTRSQACAVLGRPVPEARDLPLGLQESALTIEGPPPVGADTHRRVSLSYAIETSNVVYLDIQRGDRIPPGGASELNGSVSGSAANIRERTYPGRGGSAPFSLVFYTWARGGLLHTLTVRLDRGLTRELADQIAASVR